MSNKLIDGVIAGTTDFSTTLVLRKTADSQGMTGVAHGSVTLTTWRQGGLVSVAVTMSALTNLDDAHADGGWKEVDATNRPGEYRLDLPDAMFAAGADWVEIAVKVSGAFVFFERFAIVPKPAARVLDAVRTDHDTAGTFGEAISDIVQREKGRVTFNVQTQIMTIYETDNVTPRFQLKVQQNPSMGDEQEVLPV